MIKSTKFSTIYSVRLIWFILHFFKGRVVLVRGGGNLRHEFFEPESVNLLARTKIEKTSFEEEDEEKGGQEEKYRKREEEEEKVEAYEWKIWVGRGGSYDGGRTGAQANERPGISSVFLFAPWLLTHTIYIRSTVAETKKNSHIYAKERLKRERWNEKVTKRKRKGERERNCTSESQSKSGELLSCRKNYKEVII